MHGITVGDELLDCSSSCMVKQCYLNNRMTVVSTLSNQHSPMIMPFCHNKCWSDRSTAAANVKALLAANALEIDSSSDQ